MNDTATGDAWRPLIGRVLAERAKDHGYAARIRRGLVEHTESYAYGDVLPYVGGHDGKPVLRAAAIVASHPHIPQASDSGRRPRLGASLYAMSRAVAMKRTGAFVIDPAKPDSIAQRLVLLRDQDLDEAALSLHRILSVGDSSGVPVDYYALTKLLVRWGNGYTPSSEHMRKSTLYDYYAASAALSEGLTQDNPSQTTEQENE